MMTHDEALEIVRQVQGHSIMPVALRRRMADAIMNTIQALEYRGEPGISDPMAEYVGRLQAEIANLKQRLAEAEKREQMKIVDVLKVIDGALLERIAALKEQLGQVETTLLELWDSYSKDGNGEPPTWGRPNIANAVNRARSVVAAIRAARGAGKRIDEST